MLRFNVFDFYIFIIHKLALSISPINRERFANEFQVKSEDLARKRGCRCQSQFGRAVILNQSKGFLWVVSHPIRVIRLIKLYHMTSNTSIVCYLIYLLILINLFIKASVHCFIIGSDTKLIKYSMEVYYPPMAPIAEPYIFNKLFFSLSLFCLFVRLGNLYKLIRLSIANEFYYQDLSITQVNYTFLASFHLSISEWIKLWRQMSNHQEKIKASPEDYIEHLDFEQKNSIKDHYNHLAQNDLLYRFSIVDFKECYKDSIIGDTEARIKRYRRWHFTTPLDRMSIKGLKICIFITAGGAVVVFYGFWITILSLLHSDLAYNFSKNYYSSITRVIYSIVAHYSRPFYLLRFIENTILIASQIPQMYDSFLIALDVCTMETRIMKVVEVLKFELEVYRDKSRRNVQKSELKSKIYCLADQNQDYKQSKRLASSTNRDSPEETRYEEEFNMRILHHIRLVRLLYLEFLSIKRNHSLLLNIIVLSNGIGMSCALSVMFTTDAIEVQIIVLMAFASCLFPTLSALFFCAQSERSVSYFEVWKNYQSLLII